MRDSVDPDSDAPSAVVELGLDLLGGFAVAGPAVLLAGHL